MPAAMRQASDRIVRSLERYDFDLGGPLYDGKPIRPVDCGDVRANSADLKGHYARAEAAVRLILAAGLASCGSFVPRDCFSSAFPMIARRSLGTHRRR
jgi:arginase family enzyme